MASYSVGDYVKRNNKSITVLALDTDDTVKYLARDNEYEIVKKLVRGASHVYSLSSIQTANQYTVAHSDLTSFFEKIGKTTQKLMDKSSELPEIVKPAKPCVCDSHDLLLYGCKCGAVEGNLDDRYDAMLQELMGPRMGER